jgi:hypothetical protein
MDSEYEYRHAYYNLTSYLQFQQYYNGFGNNKNHYLYNTSNNRHVACVEGFSSSYYDYYVPVNETSYDDICNFWNDDTISKITNI